MGAIETSSLLRHADHNDAFLFPAQILAVVVVNAKRHGGIFKSLLLPPPTIITALGVGTRFTSERGVDCTPVGEERGLPYGLRFRPSPLSHARPAYPKTCRHLRITSLYYTFILMSYKPRLT